MKIKDINSKVNIRKIDYLKTLCTAIDNHLRKRIIITLYSKKMTVTQIYNKLKLEQAVTSVQLSILKKSGIVKMHKKGKYHIYYINKDLIKKLYNFEISEEQ